MPLQSIDPRNGSLVREYPEATEPEVQAALAAGVEAFSAWRRTSFEARASVLRRAAALLRERRDALARLMAVEMGKPVTQGRAEAEKCASVCDFYAERAASLLSPETAPTEASQSYVAFEPLGVVLAVMPWNFPLWQVFRFAAPALMAGNVGLLKHASNVTGCALAIGELFETAGLPKGVFRTLVVPSSRVAALIEAPEVAAVTITGSTPAGRAVASKAGAQLKKSVLELGGSDAYVVLEDADLDATAEICAASRLINGGQSCIAAKRFIVAASVADEFTRLVVERVALLQVGDPTAPGTTVGPMARADLRDGLHAQVTRAVEEGATLVTGGHPIEGDGYYYAPTVLDHVEPQMTTFVEETFGPAASIIRARDDDHAVELANDTVYGLGAAVWSRSDRGLAVGRRIRSGALFVNAMVASDPRLPFGGIGRSGYGRELSAEGTREFTNVRTVFVGAS
jgi:succinate-semialdehyde dehydrogenase / glutarate-semialdehyde dehydrogenase